MERAVDAAPDVDTEGFPPARVPRPIAGGSYEVESLGHWVDRLLGHERAVREAAENLDPLLARPEDMPEGPEPAQIPEPLPGASEPITRGDT